LAIAIFLVFIPYLVIAVYLLFTLWVGIRASRQQDNTSIIGLIIAYHPPDTIFAMAEQAFTGLAVLFPTVIAALYCRQLNSTSCIISIVVGEAAVVGFQSGIIPESLTFGFLPVVSIVALSTLIILIGVIKKP
jgi:SSS family solute:Na+ symporter